MKIQTLIVALFVAVLSVSAQHDTKPVIDQVGSPHTESMQIGFGRALLDSKTLVNIVVYVCATLLFVIMFIILVVVVIVLIIVVVVAVMFFIRDGKSYKAGFRSPIGYRPLQQTDEEDVL